MEKVKRRRKAGSTRPASFVTQRVGTGFSYEDDAIRVPPLASRAIGLDPVRPRTQKGTRKQAAAVRAFLRQAGGKLLRVPVPPSPVGRNLGILSAALGLQPTELAVLQFVLAVHSHRAFQNVVTNLPCAGEATSDDLVAFAIANPRPDVSRALAPASRLVGSGLVTVKPEHGSTASSGVVLDLALERDHQVANIGAYGRIPFGRRGVPSPTAVAAVSPREVARHGGRVVWARTRSRSDSHHAWPCVSWRADSRREPPDSHQPGQGQEEKRCTQRS
jgi:hypothetical protein